MPVNLKNNKYVEDLKKGFQDIQTVAQEGNYKLFVKQFVVVLVVFLLFKYCGGKFSEKISHLNGQMDAIRIQQTSEREYQDNKEQLLSLEPRFPDIANKNEWLLSQVLGIFKEADITPKMDGTQTEDDSNSTYTVASLRTNADMGFLPFADFLAGIENKEEYVKVSEVSIVKDTNAANLGVNKVSLRFNTIFPKEKIAKSLFKDYDKIMQERAQANTRKEKTK